ncbi:Uncharacterised protein [Mycobacteroides abscessus subsp. abscessus]|nr:Uncharacterised protein [Mycobacteroides abscessus subsp. abscessus]
MASMPRKHDTAEPASAIQARPQRRVSSASIEKPTLNTRISHTNTRDGSRIFASSATWSPSSTSKPLTAPVCGSTNDSRITKTQIATTMARPPGSISRAMRCSAASMSSLNSSNSPFEPLFGCPGLVSFIVNIPALRA